MMFDTTYISATEWYEMGKYTYFNIYVYIYKYIYIYNICVCFIYLYNLIIIHIHIQVRIGLHHPSFLTLPLFLALAPACPADPLIQQLCPVTCGVCQPPSGLTTSAVPASPKAAGATPTSASPQPPSSSTATTTAATTSVASTMAASSKNKN